MLPFRLVYHPGYNLDLGSHVFPAQKYGLLREKILADGLARPEDFVEPAPAPEEDLLLVHTPDWITRFKSGALTPEETLKLEMPYSTELVQTFWLAAGGTTQAACLALRDGIAFNIGGGFHHAFPEHGEGFCAINDIAVAIRRLQREGRIERAMIVDCDVHQGNGTASIFANDKRVFTLSVHQRNNYPAEKPLSDVDINLEDDTCDDEYLELLKRSYVPAIEGFRPHLLVYLAGADPYQDDQLGGLALTLGGLRERDRLVIDTALRHSTPVAVTLAGGYAQRLEDTLTIHLNSIKAAREAILGLAPAVRETPILGYSAERTDASSASSKW